MKLVKPLSYTFRAGIYLRHLMYDYLLTPTKLKLPVISIGNIVAGGAGKTPVVHYLASQIGPEKVAILSRGYRRKGKGIVKVTNDTHVEECGDEPLFLAQKMPQAQIIVGKNRITTGQLIENTSLSCIILDDGMQHRKLYRDIEICVINSEDIDQKHFLPFGRLREDPKRLKKADLVIINGLSETFAIATAYVRQFTQAPITGMTLEVLNAEEVRGKRVAVFCAIASPSRFYQTLEALDCKIVKKVQKKDHVPFTEKELEILAQTENIDILVCTEKDAIKLSKNLNFPIIPLRIQLTPTMGKEHIEKIIKRFQK